MCELRPLTFDVDNANKNHKKIIVFGPYKGSGVGDDDLGVALITQFLSIICNMQLIEGGVLTKNF